MEAVASKDIDFIESTSSIALRKKLKEQFKLMGNNSYIKRTDNKKYV